MAIAYGEYGPYDEATGRPVSNTEVGLIFSDTGGAYVDAPAAAQAPAPKGYQSEYVRWGGEAGQPVEYKRQDGIWVSGGAPEHAESAAYLQRAFADPQVEQLFKYAYEHPEALNTEQKSFMANPVLGLDSVGQGSRWGNLNLFDDKFNAQQAGGLLQAGGSGYLSDADKSAGAAFNFEQSPAEQSKRAEADGGFGDILPMIALAALAIYTGGAAMGAWGAGAAGAGATGTLAAADAMAGIGALEFSGGALAATSAGASGLAAADAMAGIGATEVAGLGSSGLLSSIGTNAAIGAGKSLVTGGDPLEGAVLGGIGGAISGSGMLSDVSGGLIDATGAEGIAANAITKGVNAAATGAISAAAGGGSFSDVLEAGAIRGLTSGAGNYVAGTVLPETNNTIAGGAGGAAAGLTSAILTGGDIGNAVLTGAGAGAAGGLATDLGAGPGTAVAVGALAGGLINSAVQQDPVVTGPQAVTQPVATTPAGNYGLSFSDVLPQFIHNPRADMQWGARLSGA